MKSIVAALMLVASLLLGGCGYNTIQTQDEAVKASWSEVVNQYQRRADLIPNLVNTVKGFAAQEEKVLVGVTEARARATSIQVTPELLNNPQALQKFQAAQGDLTTALKSLLMVTENYPQLKSDQNFRDLQAQLEGTENRITVARNRYIAAVQEYNGTIRKFPSNLTAMVFSYEVKPNFTVENEAAISAAETGHVVFGTLHTSSAQGTINRIIDAFPTNQQEQVRTQLSTAIIGVVSQALLPKIGGGRVAAYEILVVTPAIGNLIRENKTFRINSAIQTGAKLGMVLLDDNLFQLWESGKVTEEAVLMKAQAPDDLAARIAKAKAGVFDDEDDINRRAKDM